MLGFHFCCKCSCKVFKWDRDTPSPEGNFHVSINERGNTHVYHVILDSMKENSQKECVTFTIIVISNNSEGINSHNS